MALITERGYFYDENGVGVGGIEVNLYAKLSDGTWGGTVLATTTTASGVGKWEFLNIDTALSPQTGVFGIRFRNPATGQIRRRDGDEAFQVGNLVGANGAAPFADSSVTSSKILDGAVTDTKIGNRTIDQTLASPVSTGPITSLLSWIGRAIKDAKGTTNWFDVPPANLTTLNTSVVALNAQASTFTSHIANTNNPHNTTHSQIGTIVAADLGAGAATDTVIGNRTITDTLIPLADSNSLTSLLSNIGNMFKQVTGKSSWRVSPAITLEQAAQHAASLTNPHSTTAAQVGAVANSLNVVRAYAGATVARPTPVVAGAGALFFSTDDQQVSYSNGTAWTTLGVVDYNDLINIPSIPGSPNLFSNIGPGAIADSPTDTLNIVGGTGIDITVTGSTDTITISESTPNKFTNIAVGAATIAPDSENDTLNFAAGSGIQLTANTTTDTVTISTTGSGSVDATTIKGNDADLYPYLKAISPINTGAPALTTGPWFIQAGRVTLTSGRSAGAYQINLSGQINGYVAALVTAEPGYDAGTFFTGVITVSVSALTTGSSPHINGSTVVLYTDASSNSGLTSYNEVIKLNYWVLHW